MDNTNEGKLQRSTGVLVNTKTLFVCADEIIINCAKQIVTILLLAYNLSFYFQKGFQVKHNSDVADGGYSGLAHHQETGGFWSTPKPFSFGIKLNGTKIENHTVKQLL